MSVGVAPDQNTPTLFGAEIEPTATDERFTPPWVFHVLGETFDLDPASPVDGGDHVPALRRFTRVDDGLTQSWDGFVWLNCPWSNSTPWADRFRDHGNGIWLGPIANSRWFIELAGAADRLWIMRDFPFLHPDHKGKRSSMPLGMIALGSRAAAAIDRAASASGPGAGTLLAPVATQWNGPVTDPRIEPVAVMLGGWQMDKGNSAAYVGDARELLAAADAVDPVRGGFGE